METGFSLALSIIIASVFFLSIMQFNANITQTSVLNNMDYAAQVKLKTMVEIVKNDLNKIGYLNDPDISGDDDIKYKTNNSIKFLASKNESIKNPSIRYIEIKEDENNNRLVRNDYNESGGLDNSTEINGLDSLHIEYHYSGGNIEYLTVTIVATLPYDYKPGKYEKKYSPQAYWKSDIYPKNLDQ